MNFLNWSYLPFLIGAFVVLMASVIYVEKKFFSLIHRYWFYKRSIFSWISSILFIAGMGGLLLSLLDARGPEERVKTPVPKQRTIILIDTSASMLAEDVKPNRLQKAALIAKHFARKAAGHQLAIVAFAEIQKPIVPFTNDLDLIDARLDSLKNLRNQYGSSALTVAVQESLQYFLEAGGDVQGNLLVLTDGEETSAGVKLKIPDGVHVAFVGVGTTQGGRIPLDDGRGFRFGYKKDRGQDVITKLNENFFKATVSDIASAKYWLANTYSLPSEEILEFFQAEEKKSEEKQDMVIRPVMMEWIVIPSLILLLLSWLFKSIRVFTLGVLLLLGPVRAEDKVELSPETIKKMQELQEGKLNPRQKVKLADELYRAGAKAEAVELFDESLPKTPGTGDIPNEAYLNYGTALLQNGRVQDAFGVYDSLNQKLSTSPEDKALKEKMEKNSLAFFQQQKEQQKKQDKDKKDSEQKKDQQNQSGDQQNQGQSGQDKQQQGKSGKDQKDDKGEKDKKEDQKKDQDNKDGEGEENKDEQKPKEDQEPQEGEPKPMPPKKLAPKLKQLMSDDRQLQMRMIEQGTRELNRKKLRNSKDW